MNLAWEALPFVEQEQGKALRRRHLQSRQRRIQAHRAMVENLYGFLQAEPYNVLVRRWVDHEVQPKTPHEAALHQQYLAALRAEIDARGLFVEAS